ncbi:F-box protein At3g07870-like [Durio zibethinus]|uniref:F-box protein At3g07870-like n=1 Tax=Durio zibethinus TaxID=66656 RepID=A0A6P6A524_DURZI|nr:F-box protein At3g07870-like [Durio zibethinus]
MADLKALEAYVSYFYYQSKEWSKRLPEAYDAKEVIDYFRRWPHVVAFRLLEIVKTIDQPYYALPFGFYFSNLSFKMVATNFSAFVNTGEKTMKKERFPHEVVVRVLNGIPLTSLLNVKLVCRARRSLIRDPLLFTKHFLHTVEADNDPSFMLQSNWPIRYQLHFLDFSEHIEVVSKKLPSYAMLMKMYPANVGQFGFGFHPTTKEYKAVQIVYPRRWKRGDSNVPTSTSIQSEVQILTVGSPAWRNLGMIPYRLIWPTSKVMVNGRLHWLSMPNKYSIASLLISFDLETEQFQEVSKSDCCGLDRCFHHVTVLRGRLSAGAYHDNEQLEIWVMKEYGMKESWIKEFIVGTNYLPHTLKQEEIWSFSNSNFHFPNSFVQVLCILKSGEVLLEYKSRALVLYDPRRGTFKDFTFPDMPNWFKIITHVGSLNWLDSTPSY